MNVRWRKTKNAVIVLILAAGMAGAVNVLHTIKDPENFQPVILMLKPKRPTIEVSKVTLGY